MLLKGKKALVTGGSRGIGRAVAIALAREGVNVALTYYRDSASADATASEVRRFGCEAHVLHVNLSEPSGIDELFTDVERLFGELDVFVHNAVSAALRPVMELKLRHWERILDTNLTAFFQCAVQAARLMRHGGNIIATSSLGSQKIAPGYAALGVAKAGVETLARYLAVELASRHINVNVICPGVVSTDALEAFSSVVPSINDYKVSLVERTPAGRIGEPGDVAGIVVFLCTPEAQWIRGQTITADGGLSLMM